MTRRLVCAAIALGMGLLLAAHAARAQSPFVDVTPRSPAQTMACLVKSSEKPAYPLRYRHDPQIGTARLKLTFDRPDTAPRVEVLQRTMPDDMFSAVLGHVEGYRLPCLGGDEGGATAVQEFSFTRGDTLLPLSSVLDTPGICAVDPPRGDKPYDGTGSSVNGLDHVLVLMTFSGDGEAPPDVKVVWTDAPPAFQDYAKARAAEIRMPCRKTGDQPTTLSRHYLLRPPGRYTKLTKRNIDLRTLLLLISDLQTVRGSFDFTTMNCPFKVNVTMYQPHLRNQVDAGRPVDPNRVAFLHWLAERPIALSNTRRGGNDLYGETLQVDIPCTRLELDPAPETSRSETAAAPSP